MLIEREKDLAALNEHWASVSGTGGRVVLVCGEAGIGKSSLVSHFMSTLETDTKIAMGLCDPLSTPRPMGAIREVQEQLRPNIQSDRAGGAGGSADLLFDFFQASNRPIIIFLEDMHWADQGTLDWFKYIGRRIRALPVLLILSFRDDEVPLSHPLSSAIGQIPASNYHRLQLSPLSVDGISEMALPDGVSAAALYQTTGGNPFFVTEILNDQDASTDVPQSVKDAVNSRVNRLPRDLQSFLEMSACHPTSIRTEILHALHGDYYTGALAEATRLKLLVAVQGHFRFRHELARLAIYARLSASERQAAHARILKALLKQPGQAFKIDEIVHHADGAQDSKKVLEYAPIAATQAAELGAHREAAQHLAAAIRYIDSATTEKAAQIYQDWAYEAGLALRIDDDVIEARRLAITLWRTLGRSDKVGENLRWLSRLHWYRGEAVKANTYVDEAVKVLESDEASPEKAMGFAIRSQFHMLQDRMDDSIRWGERSLEMARSVGADDVEVHALNTVGTAKLFRGDSAGEQMLLRSLDMAKRFKLHEQAARVYTNLSEYAVETRQFDKAETLLNAGLAFDQEHDLDSWTYYLMGRQAQLRLGQQSYRQACEIADGVLNKENQTLLMRLPAKIVKSRALLRVGDKTANEMIEGALTDALSVDELQYTVVMRSICIERAFLTHDVELAKYHFGEISKLDGDMLSAEKWSDILIWAYLARVNDQLPEGVDTSAALDALYSAEWREAANLFEQDLLNYEAAWCRCMTEEASEIQRADQYFAAIEATGAQKSLRRFLANKDIDADLSPIVRGPNKKTRQNAYGLTGKEQVVLAKVVEGASNAMIASELSRSVRTIENHVSAILSKLNAANRVELILRTQSEPWIL